jgi:hypothetical protein
MVMVALTEFSQVMGGVDLHDRLRAGFTIAWCGDERLDCLHDRAMLCKTIRAEQSQVRLGDGLVLC